MALNDYYNETITFIKDNCTTKQQVFDKLANALVESKVTNDKDRLIQDLKERESIGSTAMSDGIAIPHCASKTVKKPTITIMTLKQPINWETDDVNGKAVDLIFMITTPLKTKQQHLQVLAQLAGFLADKEVIEKIRNANDFTDIDQIFSETNLKQETTIDRGENYDVVAITACSTGIAHTYMAKEKIEEAALNMGYSVKVETRGRSGGENILTDKDIANAKVIILAVDKKIVGMNKFKGYKYLETSTKDVIYNGEKVIEDYLQGKRLTLCSIKKGSNDEVAELTLKNFKDVTKNLLGGVSRMLPFVVAGGIILGIGFLLDSGNNGGNFGVTRSSAAWFSGLGKTIFAMVVPILGAYVCYSIVGPQGLLPGMTCGLIANVPEILYDSGNKTGAGWSNVWGRIFPSIPNFNSGFFGALVGSYIIAFFIYGCQKGFSRFYKSFRGVRDIVLIPVLSALAAGALMFVLNIPLGYLNKGFGLLLEKTANYNLNALIGIIIGIMMAVDMGGPINKAAYVFSTLTIDASQTTYESIRSTNGGTVFMAASMLAGMVPPLALAISTRLFGKAWSKKDKETGNTNWFLSACFITEGAIPYAAADPKRVVPSIMVGSALTGAIVSAFGITLAAPHGGIFVFPLLRIQDNGSNWINITNQGWSISLAIFISLIAVLIGAFVSAIMLGFWRMKGIKSDKLILNK